MSEVLTAPAPKVKIHWRLRRRLDQAYDNAYWGYVCAREIRHEPDMLWWGTHVVRIRVLRSGQSEEKVTVQLVEALERELQGRGAILRELFEAPEEESQDTGSNTPDLLAAAEQELQDARPNTTIVVEAPQQELQEPGPNKSNGAGPLQRELVKRQPELSES